MINSGEKQTTEHSFISTTRLLFYYHLVSLADLFESSNGRAHNLTVV